MNKAIKVITLITTVMTPQLLNLSSAYKNVSELTYQNTKLKMNDEFLYKEIIHPNSSLTTDAIGQAGWFNGTPTNSRSFERIIVLGDEFGRDRNEIEYKFDSITINGKWRTLNYAKRGSLDFKWEELYKQKWKPLSLKYSIKNHMGKNLRYDYIEWNQHSGAYYNNATFNVVLNWNDDDNIVLKVELIVKARVGGSVYAAYTLASGMINNLTFNTRYEAININNLKTNDVDINLFSIKNETPEKLKESIILDIGHQNIDKPEIKNIIDHVTRYPKLWSISGIDFSVPETGREKKYTAKFQAKNNNPDYSGYIGVNVTLKNLETKSESLRSN